MRECWNWQTGTFEVRVSTTYGFKSRLAHQKCGMTFWSSHIFCEIEKGLEPEGERWSPVATVQRCLSPTGEF